MSSLQQRVGSSLSLVVELLFHKRHLCCLSMFPWLPGSSLPDRGQHYHRTLSVIRTFGAHCTWSLSPGGQKEHTPQSQPHCLKSGHADLFQHKLHFEGFFFFPHWVKNKQRKTFFFQVWVIAFDLFSTALKKPVHPDSPTAQATPWAAQYIPWEAAPALSLSYQDWRGSDRISGGSSSSSITTTTTTSFIEGWCAWA